MWTQQAFFFVSEQKTGHNKKMVTCKSREISPEISSVWRNGRVLRMKPQGLEHARQLLP